MKNNYDGIFSKDELSILKNFANNAVKEDRRIHGISNNYNNNNKQNQFISKKEEKPPQPKIQQKPVKKIDQSKPVISKPTPVKKEEKPINKTEQIKPQIKIEKAKEAKQTITSPPEPKVEYMNAIFPETIKNNKNEKPKEEIKKIPKKDVFEKAPKVSINKKEESSKHEIKPKIEQPKKSEPLKPKVNEIKPKENQKIEKPKIKEPKSFSKNIDIEKRQPKYEFLQKEPKIPTKKTEEFSSLRNTLIKNMQTREKPEKKETPSEPIKVIKSAAMQNMVEAMNRHYEENTDTIDEPVQVISGEGDPSIPPPPPPPPGIGSTDQPITTGIPPPPPPPPPPTFAPSKIPKKPKKPVVKKKAPPPPPPKPSGPTMKELLMNVSLKKVGK